MTHKPNSGSRPCRPLLFILFGLTLVLGAASCGAADDSSSDGATTASATDTSSGVVDSGGSQGQSSSNEFGDAAEAIPASREASEAIDEDAMDQAMEEAMDDGAMVEEEATDAEAFGAGESTDSLRVYPATSSTSKAIDVDSASEPTQERARDSDDAEGLFVDPEIEPIAPVPTPRPTPDRLVDNRFIDYGYRRFIDADTDPFSTFALDVDTGSYTVVRRWLNEGAVPPPAAVRAEEFINWFDYDYEVPRRGLEISVDGGPSPFDEDNLLVRVGVQAEIVADNERPPVALTFIVDTSGSMDRDDRLGLVRSSLHTLVDELDDDDTVAIVVYSDSSGVLLEPTEVADEDEIHDAIDDLRPGGSTNLESGLREGYALALEAFRDDGINRVIIASDGVANAGVTDSRQLSGLIRGYADQDIQLVTVGYGMGNFNDTMMEQLADNGDGFYAYVDSEDEAERLFEDELTSALVTAAIDAKIQVEFDPDVVDEYRLIGFENRGVRDDDFRNDAVDAGELGAGHQVTAMYEVELRRGVTIDDRGDIGEVFLRWEDPDSGEVIEIDEDIDLRDVEQNWRDTELDYQLATVATAFGEVMRDNPYADEVNLSNISNEAERLADVLNDDKLDELVELLEIAQSLY